MTKQKESVKIVKLTDFNFPPEVFIPLKSGKFIDTVISKKGGTMPATISIVVGEPGSGKTTMLVDKMTGIESHNPDKKCLYISSEMNPIDNRELAEELPQLMNLNTLYMADYDNPKLALEQALDMGWDYVIMDSNKMNASTVETWLINLLVKHTKGQNEGKKYTAFDVIQHITKGGEYAGSTKLKHNTTAMVYVRIDEVTGQRYLVYVKNRRGDIRKKLYMVLDKVSGEINYDSKKYNELEKAIEIQKQMDSFQNENDQKLLELLQKSETSDKEIVSKTSLTQYNTEIDATVERVRNGEFVTNDEVFEELESED